MNARELLTLQVAADNLEKRTVRLAGEMAATQAAEDTKRLSAILTKRGLTPVATRAVIGVLTAEGRLDASKDYLETRLELGDFKLFDAHRAGARTGGQEEPAPPPPPPAAPPPPPDGHGVLLAALGGPAPVVQVDPQAPGASARQAAQLVLAACGQGGEP